MGREQLETFRTQNKLNNSSSASASPVIICPYCQKEANWCENKVIYGKNYGKSFMCYYCDNCDAYVGCHQNTKTPLGTMANKELRSLRIKVHAKIDPLWKSGKMTRKEVYKMIDNIHIGESTIKQCKDLLVKL